MSESFLFQTPYGSHLFGTNHALSDYDYKVVFLPSLDDLLLNQKISNRVEKPDGKGANAKMGAEEVEKEFIPLQVFLDHVFMGQTYALEMVFAVLQDKYTTLENANSELAIAEESEFIILWMSMLAKNFVTSNIQKMVGFAVSQSQNYGLKTERYTALLNTQKLITSHFRHYITSADKLAIAHEPDLLEKVVSLGFGKMSQIKNGKGGVEFVPAVDIAGKLFPMNTKWSTINESIASTVDKYGSRVKGHINQPADWKALSHAIRVTEQVIELSENRNITFPRPNAKFLLDVKEGKIDFDKATEYLATQFNRIKHAEIHSVLPERSDELTEKFEKFKLNLLKTYYALNGSLLLPTLGY